MKRIINFFVKNLLWTEGYILVFIIFFLFCTSFIYPPLQYLAFFGLCIGLLFFRNPTRICPEYTIDQALLICPADGKIVAHEYGNFFEGCSQRLSIFLSLLDVHVQWIPVDGIIENVSYSRGQFFPAFLEKAAHKNEHNDIFIRTPHKQLIVVRQIAGIIAQRISCWLQPHTKVTAGQKYGMIKFSSRVDIFLPASIKVYVKVGDTVLGGTSILGRWP